MFQEAKYGSGFYKNVSGDLQDVFPDVPSFSVTNLKYMKYFYELYADMKSHPQVEDNFENAIYYIPWGHNKLIIDKCKGEYAKAIFYVQKTIENN